MLQYAYTPTRTGANLIMKKVFATIAAAAVLLTACNSVAKPQGSQPAPQQQATPSNAAGGSGSPSASAPTPTPAPKSADTTSVTPAAQSSQTTPAASPAPSTASTPTAAAQPPSPPAEIKKDYHMNKNYDIVPNDPNGNKRVVLLTFDDGPKEQEMIDSLFDTLDKHKAKAIFFMNGYRIKAHPELLKLIDQRGGVIGNHAWDHDDLKKATNAKVDQQVDDVIKIMQDTVGKKPQFFRPPYGSGNDYLRSKVKEEGMLYMTWSNGSLDWEMTNKKNDPNKVVQNVLDQLHFGSNILMHELPWTCQMLDTLLTKLEEKGYSFIDPREIELEMR
jgi:peptidoglycan/xylan/chitin deacetylase (PgdA/CDA1 family)